MRQLIAEMSEEKAIIISTHILEEVEAVCTRAIIIANGRIVADETPAALLARSDHHNAVSLQIIGDIDIARQLLQDLPMVSSVEVGKRNGLLVRPKDGARILNAVRIAMRGHDITIGEIHIAHGHLDQVFRSITTVP